MDIKKLLKIEKTGRISAALFLIALLLRILSSVFMTDGRTGFAIPEYRVWSIVINLASAAFAAGGVIFMGRHVKFSPNGISPDILLALISAAVAVLSVKEGFTTESAATHQQWQIALVQVFGMLNAVFFFAYAISGIFGVKLPRLVFAIPLVHSMIRLVRFFAVTTSITVITDNIFSLIFDCIFIFFMLHFANVANAIGGKTSVKKLRIYGYAAFSSSMLCSIPRLAKLICDSNAKAHESIVSTVFSLVLGLFALVLTFNVFDKKKKKADNNTESIS